MTQEATPILTAADLAAVITLIAQQSGIEPGILIRIATHALAEHIREQGGKLTLPLRIIAIAQPEKSKASTNILSGPWT